jgi:hypothetical protein
LKILDLEEIKGLPVIDAILSYAQGMISNKGQIPLTAPDIIDIAQVCSFINHFQSIYLFHELGHQVFQSSNQGFGEANRRISRG